MSRSKRAVALTTELLALRRQRLLSSGLASASGNGGGKDALHGGALFCLLVRRGSFLSSKTGGEAMGENVREKWKREARGRTMKDATTARYYSTEKKTSTTDDDDKEASSQTSSSSSSTANPLAGMMFPWERAVLSSERNEGPTPWWHKLYWFVFAFCVLLIASNRIREQFEQTNETERRELELKRNRRAMARALEGRSFVGTREYDPRTDSLGPGEDEEEESDPFEGLEPHEIAALVAKEAPDGDVYAGWSPEEIQEYEEKSRREREKEKKGVFEMPPNVVSKK
jgi:hypothetical protein